MKWRLVVVGVLGLAAPACLPCDREAPIESAAQLSALDHCEVIAGSLIVQGLADLTSIRMPNLREVTGGIIITENPALTQASLPALDVVNSVASPEGQVAGLSMSFNEALVALELPSLTTVGAPDSGASLFLGSMPALTGVDLGALETIDGGLSVVGTGIATWDFALTTLDSLVVADNPALTAVRMPSLVAVEEEVTVGGAGLVEIDLSGLQAVKQTVGNQRGQVEIVGSPVLETLTLSSLAEVGIAIEIESNARLSAIELPALTSAPLLHVIDNDSLERVAAATIASMEVLAIRSNPRLSSIAFPVLTLVGSFEVSFNDTLPTCAVAALVEQLDPQGFTSFAVENNLEDACGPRLDPPQP